MVQYSQSNRSFALRTNLGDDALLVAKFAGVEAISEPFSFVIDVLSEQMLNFDDLLLAPATLRLSYPGSPTRYVNGILCEIEEDEYQAGPAGPQTFIRYRVELVPAMWRLSLRTQSRIWQRKSVPQILQEILKSDWGLPVKMQLASEYMERDYCVQYQESDLSFVRRLMEEEGIWFLFQHEIDKHTLIIGDAPNLHPMLQSPSEILYDPTKGVSRGQGQISQWKKRRRAGSTKVRIRDFHFERPISAVEATAVVSPTVQMGQATNHFTSDDTAKIDDYPASFVRHFDRIQPDGEDVPAQFDKLFPETQRVAQLRAQAEAVKALLAFGQSDCSYLVAGSRFSLRGHFCGDGPYLLTRVTHQGDQEATFLTGSGEKYSNTIEAIPAEVPFRPQRVTPRPQILSTQTAVVVGAEGAETFLDRFGRVKVKFFWDTRDESGPQSSCWVRVAQVWAGRRWGAFFWPRIGNEVVVSFENGDPERPLIVGSVYNDRNMPPFEMPANATRAGIKSFSMSGDANAVADPMMNFNGLVFHDAQGEEHTELHSERSSFQTSEYAHIHNVNGIHRINVSDRHSLHVGCLPGSGFGAGDSSGGSNSSPTTPQCCKEEAAPTPAFTYSATSDANKKIGMSLSSVVGLNQTNTLGIYGAFTVGDTVTIVNNPIGLLADSVAGFADAATGLAQIGSGLLGSNIGGVINVIYGSQTTIAYGSQIAVNRAGRAFLSTSTNYGDDKLAGPASALNKVAWKLAVVLSALNLAGLTGADMTSYSGDYWEFEALLETSLGIMAVMSEIEIAFALAVQVDAAKKAATAVVAVPATPAAPGDEEIAAQLMATNADNLVTMLTNDQKTQNKLEYTGGCHGNYSDARITGVQDCQMLFAGAIAGSQSVVAMNAGAVKIVVHETGSALAMTPASITLGVGPTCKIVMTPESILLQCGENTMTLTEEGLEIEVTACAIDTIEGVKIESPGGILTLLPEGASLAGLTTEVAAETALALTALEITREASATITDESPMIEA
jgi:type VI secretion system secreted protein VgrG